MATASLEHMNVTIAKPLKMAQTLCAVFGWEIRWQGKTENGGEYLHVGNEGTYLSMSESSDLTAEPVKPYSADRAINHIGIVVDDLGATRNQILAAGLQIADENAIAPGRRIYFFIQGLEFEAVQY